MKTDSFGASLVWGRIGAAVLALLSFALQLFGIDFATADQAGANETISGILAGIAGLLALVSKLREQYRAKQARTAQAGSARAAVIVALAVVCVALAAGFALSGCAHKSATQQLLEQTSDPGIIARGTFADAQDLYIAAQELYLPYQQTLKQRHPELDAEIVGQLRKANAVLDDWQRYGDVPVADKERFRNYLRDVSLSLARMLEAGQKGGE